MDETILNELRGKQVFVTGGTGFIGGRLIEKMVSRYDIKVKALVSNYRNLFRVARYPIEIVYGDILNYNAIRDGLTGCDFLIHCAFGNKGSYEERKRINVEGTRNVLEAGKVAGVKRIVHISTFSVYELQDTSIDENSPYTSVSTAYTDSKIEAEKLVFEYYDKYNIPVTVIQPSIVYGPFATGWTVGVVEQLMNGKIILVNDGEGYCNAVYVDDVVDAILLATINRNAVGEKFIISYEKPITWKEFYSAFEELSGIRSTVSMTVDEAKNLYKIQQKMKKKPSLFKVLPKLLTEHENVRHLKASRELSYTVKLLRATGLYDSMKSKFTVKEDGRTKQSNTENHKTGDSKELIVMPPHYFDSLAKKPVVDISKAKQKLGFKPKYDFTSGMQLTNEWIRWAAILPRDKIKNRKVG